MFAQKARGAVIVLTCLSLPASQADACEFLRRCFGGHQAAYYAPPAPVCCPQPACCPQPTVSYMPQTCYRTVYQNVPVVAYRPMTACDPCTGCPRTVMQPVTSYVAQPRLVAYTSYRPVVTANYCPSPCATGCAPVTAAYAPSPCATGCAPAATTVAYPAVPVAAPAVAAPAAPSCCAGSPVVSAAPPGAVGSTVTSLAPATSVPYASSGTATPVYSSTPGTTAAPTLAPQSAPAQSTTPETTFEQQPATEPESRMMNPQPLQLNPSTTLGAPRALDPEGGDRMTARPLDSTMTARLVSSVKADVLDGDDGWRASSK
ncbi:MAG: hypothetical protein AB7O59_17185 [Pirellulales bacterium]